jgi:hypothetical protein
MGLFRNAKETVEEVRGAAQSVGEAAELQTLALVCVSLVAVTALALATVALISAQEEHP